MGKSYEYPYTPASERPQINFSFLSPEEQAVFQARYTDALTIAETKTKLGISEYEYRSRMARARDKILANQRVPKKHRQIVRELFSKTGKID